MIIGVALLLACAPQAADRVTLTDAPVTPADAQIAAPDAGVQDSDASDAADARSDRPLSLDTAPPDRSLPPDLGPDASSVPDTQPPMDASPEAPASQIVLLVVGNPAMLSGGDTRLRTALVSKGFTIRIVDDGAAVNVTGIRLVVLSGSCASATLGTKYREVMVPVLSTEAAVYDSMGMTAAAAADLGRTVGTTLTILLPDHPMAAGLQGNVVAANEQSNLGWGRPAAGAERVATIAGMADQVAIFGYPRGAMMTTGPAADRRVGFFGTENAAPNLNAAGVRLLNAAIDWALLP